MSGIISVTVTGSKEIAAKLARMSNDLARGQALARATKAGALLIENRAKALAPYKTGNLRRSIHTEITHIGGHYAEAKVGTDVEYAAGVEYGTKAHVIRPKSRKALAFAAPVGSDIATHKALYLSSKTGRLVTSKKSAGKTVVRSVRHPGTKAKPFLRPAFDEQRQAVVREIGEALKAILKL